MWRAVNAAILTTIIALLLVQFHFVTNAQPAAPAPQPAAQPATSASSEADESELDKVNICRERIKNFAEGQRNDFGEFMNQHFAQSRPTSDLIGEAMERYRAYRKALQEEVARYGREGGAAFGSTSADISGCPQVLEEEFQLLESIIRQHILQSAYAKKSTLLLKKYQRINEQLETLNFSVAELLGNFGSFAQKVPCYTEKCTSS
ncbi:hypothetical protein COV82_03700 [Candidatus Peregrinibacteria bacterium CG11_big_fil_rev_8_21_14_0_20_46_8]|nr:MAG: hypothetical protein COV82_03700 [Candidatus Peregrinibacteria bacterium CG11_big_fil_rev_8_21_14_0_20_46_8]